MKRTKERPFACLIGVLKAKIHWKLTHPQPWDEQDHAMKSHLVDGKSDAALRHHRRKQRVHQAVTETADSEGMYSTLLVSWTVSLYIPTGQEMYCHHHLLQYDIQSALGPLFGLLEAITLRWNFNIVCERLSWRE